MLFSFFLSGCGISEPIEISPSIYYIHKRDTAGIFGNPRKMQIDVIKKASSFAASRNRIAAPVSYSFTPMGSGPAQFASLDYKFHILTPDEYLEYQNRIAETERKRARDIESLTPAQRLGYEQRQVELAQGAQALVLMQQSINQAASAQFQNALQSASMQFQNASFQSQQINAYNRRTDMLSRPVDISLKGNINHTFNPW